MNCPVCGKEMEAGVLNTLANWDYFLPQGAPKPKWLTTGRHREAGRDCTPKSVYKPEGCRSLGTPRLGLPQL